MDALILSDRTRHYLLRITRHLKFALNGLTELSDNTRRSIDQFIAPHRSDDHDLIDFEIDIAQLKSILETMYAFTNDNVIILPGEKND